MHLNDFMINVIHIGDKDIVVIVVRNGPGDPSSNRGWGSLHFT